MLKKHRVSKQYNLTLQDASFRIFLEDVSRLFKYSLWMCAELWIENEQRICGDGKCLGGKGEWFGTETQRHWIKGGKVIRSGLPPHMGLLIESNETRRDKDHQSLWTYDTFSPAHIPLSSSDTEGGMEEKSVLSCCLQKRQTHTHSYVEHNKGDDKLPRRGTVAVCTTAEGWWYSA